MRYFPKRNELTRRDQQLVNRFRGQASYGCQVAQTVAETGRITEKQRAVLEKAARIYSSPRRSSYSRLDPPDYDMEYEAEMRDLYE